MALSDADFHYIARETKARIGLMLTPDKAHLLEMRLTPVARREGFLSVQELITTARARQDDRLLWTVADTLTVNETSFFRDRSPFTLLRDQILPDLARTRGGDHTLRILSAGCSTGQEPYSIAMMLDDMRGSGRGVDCEITAIDVSGRTLEKARAGMYSQFEVQRGLPISLLVRHFEKVGDMWRASDRVRAAVKFQKANLLDELSSLGRFDVILCRNALIYFDTETREGILSRLADILEPDGYLMMGAAEANIGGAAFAPSPKMRGAYVPTPLARAAA